jgi:hypothetical protein
LPEDLLGYSKIVLHFRFELAHPSEKGKDGRPVRTYFGETLVGIINVLSSNQMPMVYSPIESMTSGKA